MFKKFEDMKTHSFVLKNDIHSRRQCPNPVEFIEYTTSNHIWSLFVIFKFLTLGTKAYFVIFLILSILHLTISPPVMMKLGRTFFNQQSI